jgi:mRNA interferase HigB
LRVIARKTLKDFVAKLSDHKDCQAVESALNAWFHEVRLARWETSADIKRLYASASIVNAERIVFNIKGNAYRLVVAVDFEKQIV